MKLWAGEGEFQVAVDNRRRNHDFPNMQIIRLFLKVAGWIITGVAILDLTGAYFLYRHAEHYVQTASRAQGTVTKMVEQHGQESGTTFAPVFQFTDPQGKVHEVQSSIGSSPPDYKVGETVTVLYPPENPEAAVINGFIQVWLWPALLAGFGAVLLALALGMFVVAYILGRVEKKKPAIPCPAPPGAG